jgi:hypothetical protein
MQLGQFGPWNYPSTKGREFLFWKIREGNLSTT